MGLIAYGLIALAILGALGGIGYKVRSSGYDACKVEWQAADAAASDVRVARVFYAPRPYRVLTLGIVVDTTVAAGLLDAQDIGIVKCAVRVAWMNDFTKADDEPQIHWLDE